MVGVAGDGGPLLLFASLVSVFVSDSLIVVGCASELAVVVVLSSSSLFIFSNL